MQKIKERQATERNKEKEYLEKWERELEMTGTGRLTEGGKWEGNVEDLERESVKNDVNVRG